ncbi:hypothetical protein IWZ00DRAFT_366736 [Phyllosticta capitalensis]|uniref:uncharacterized protein n=1 Tax=Phyllosticta capitalensis TaxID=121624 RepID=UPI0031327158
MAFFVDFELHKCSGKAAEAVQLGSKIGLPPDETPQIPPLELFDPSTSSGKKGDDLDTLPSVHDCAIHLELLHCIHRLRNEVQSSALIKCMGQEPDESKQYKETRALRWSVFLRTAVIRFLLWLEDGSMLPPLDILMVWQACLLNPVYFANLCIEKRCNRIRETPFPWDEIHAAIDFDQMSYRLTTANRERFEQQCGLASDLLSVIESGGREKILDQMSAWLPDATIVTTQSFPPRLPIGNAVRVLLENCIKASEYEQTVNDIAAAVDRQYSFVEKMEQHLWLRSPAVVGTLERAIERYEKFLKLLKWHKGIMLVPTLDIDLVWHTHQCAGVQYQMDMQNFVGAFIDHDDKLGKPILKGGETKTEELFRMHFDSEYMRCLCWDCEAIWSELESVRLSKQRLDKGKRRDMARRIAGLVSYYRSREVARQSFDKDPE